MIRRLVSKKKEEKKKEKKEEEEEEEDEEDEEVEVLDEDVVVIRDASFSPFPAPPLLSPDDSAAPPSPQYLERLTGFIASLVWGKSARASTDAASLAELLLRSEREKRISDTFRGDDAASAILETTWDHHPTCRPMFPVAETNTKEDQSRSESAEDDDERKRARDVTSKFLDEVRELRLSDKRGHDHTNAALWRLWASSSPLAPSSSVAWNIPLTADLVAVKDARVRAVVPARVLGGGATDKVPAQVAGVALVRAHPRWPSLLTSAPLASAVDTSSSFDPEKYVVMLRGISRGNEVEMRFPGRSRLVDAQFAAETVRGVVVAQYASPEQPLVVEVPPSRILVKVDLSSAEAAMKDGIFLYPPGYDSGVRYGRSVYTPEGDRHREVVAFTPLLGGLADLRWVSAAVCPDAADVLASHGPDVFRSIFNFRQARSLAIRVADLQDGRRSASLEKAEVASVIRRLLESNAEAIVNDDGSAKEKLGEERGVEEKDEWLQRALAFGKVEFLEAVLSRVAVDSTKKKSGGGGGGILTDLLRLLCLHKGVKTRWSCFAVVPDRIMEDIIDELLCTDDIGFVKTLVESVERERKFVQLLMEDRTYASMAHVDFLLRNKDVLPDRRESLRSLQEDTAQHALLRILMRVLTHCSLTAQTRIQNRSGMGNDKKYSLRALCFLTDTRHLKLLFGGTATDGWNARAPSLEDARQFREAVVSCVRCGEGYLVVDMVEKRFVDVRQIQGMLVTAVRWERQIDLFQTIADVAAETWQPRVLEYAIDALGARPNPDMLVSACRPSRLFEGVGVQDHMESVRNRAGGLPAGRKVVDALLRRGVGPNAWRDVAERKMQNYGMGEMIVW